MKRRSFLLGAGALGSVAAFKGIQTLLADDDGTNPSGTASGEVADDRGNATVTILQTTDVHCQVHPHDEMFWENDQAVYRKTGGYAHLATYLKQERAKHAHSFLMDTGDMFQGSELSVKTTGQAMVPILNALGYDLYLPGNWEVVYYKKAMQALLGSLHAPKICANMFHDAGEGKRGELIFPPYHIWTVNGVKIGFLGYTDHLVPVRQSPNYSKGILYSKPEENTAYYVDVLRNQEKCAAVIIIAHMGLSQQIALANLPVCEGVDYIFGGDTHERVRVPIACSYAKVVEPGAFGSFVGRLEMRFENGKLVKDTYTLDEVNAETYPADAKLANIIAVNEAPFKAEIDTIVGYSTLPLYRYFVIENPMDTMILNALNWKLKDIDVVLSNGFRFCPPRTTPDHTGNVPITAGYLFDMLPVDSNVRVAQANGAQIKKWLEKELNNVFAKEAAERFGGWVIKFQGMTIEFEAFAPKGQRVKKALIHGEPIELSRMYTLSACERDGDPDDILCRIKGVKNGLTKDFTLHEVIKEYLAVNSPVTPTPPMAAKVLDAPQTLLTQVSGVDYQFV